jgi:hypothetical protein
LEAERKSSRRQLVFLFDIIFAVKMIKKYVNFDLIKFSEKY